MMMMCIELHLPGVIGGQVFLEGGGAWNILCLLSRPQPQAKKT